MTIEQDAEQLLGLLGRQGEGAEQGHHEFEAQELVEATGLSPRRLNDAVSLLKTRGAVDVEPGKTREFAFAAVSLNASGRHAFQNGQRTPRLSASAHKLATEILGEISRRPLTESLREARKLAAQCGSDELRRFVGVESDGYYENTMPNWGFLRAPDYRTIGVQPVDVSGRQIMIASAEYGFLSQYTLRQSVSELEDMVAAPHAQFSGADPLWVDAFNTAIASLGRKVSVEGGGSARVKGLVFEKPAVRGVLSRVADRLTDLVGAIAAEGPDEREAPDGEDRPTIGIVTALDEEAVAVQWALGITKVVHRTALGRPRRFDVAEIPSADGAKHVVAHYCVGKGNTRAGTRAAALFAAFPSIEYVVMCGIAGAVPNPAKAEHHVRLGDIVVCNDQGVIEFNVGNDEGPEKFIPKHPVRSPAAALLDAVAELRRQALGGKQAWLDLMNRAPIPTGLIRPLGDVLIDGLDVSVPTDHPPDAQRRVGVPRVFDGPIASSNAVLKDPKKRDALRDRYGVKAVEMEGAGIAEASWDSENGFIVVRGACDYCNPNKGDDWHLYAAYAAAAYCRALIDALPASA